MDIDTAYDYKAYQALANSVLPCEYHVLFTRPVADRYHISDGVMTGAGVVAKRDTKACNNISINMSWSIPVARENGDPLPIGELAGYEIDLNGTIYKVMDPNLTTYTINGLVAGEYVCMIRSVDTDGVVSNWSDPVAATI